MYGLQDVEHEGGDEGFASLDAMAARYAEEILDQHPEGSYHVLGFSAGGTIAYAVATHLHQAGASVGTVFILDALPPNLPPYVHAQVIRPFLMKRARHHAGELIRSPHRAVRKIRGLIQTAQSEFGVPEEDARQLEPVDLVSGEDRYVALRQRYVPPPCPVQVVLIETVQAQESYNLARAWRHLVGDAVERHQVEADDHLTVLRGPSLHQVVEIVQGRLT